MELDPLKYLKATAPMPVILVSTLHGDVKNAAPYAWHMPISMDPPLIGVAIRKSRDTYKNIVDTEEFVVCVPGKDLLQKIKDSARAFPREVSEFEKVGFTPLKSSFVAPFGIEECITNIECKLEWMKEAGDHDVVVGRVVNVQVSDELADIGIEGNFPHPVIHVGGGRNYYASIGDILE